MSCDDLACLGRMARFICKGDTNQPFGEAKTVFRSGAMYAKCGNPAQPSPFSNNLVIHGEMCVSSYHILPHTVGGIPYVWNWLQHVLRWSWTPCHLGSTSMWLVAVHIPESSIPIMILMSQGYRVQYVTINRWVYRCFLVRHDSFRYRLPYIGGSNLFPYMLATRHEHHVAKTSIKTTSGSENWVASPWYPLCINIVSQLLFIINAHSDTKINN